VVEDALPHAPEVVWAALTTAELIGRWLMPNDFAPEVGSDTNPAYGARLDTVVTWTLTPVAGGTRLRMVHAGFRSPGNDFAFDAMSPGWGRVMLSIARVIAQPA
jgi:uncharacterized protein YndB with AHSA1/START domain